jgi:DNA-binding transcriptional LysR family regulator
LNSQDLVFFIKVCDTNFKTACSEFFYHSDEGTAILERLEGGLNFKLFEGKNYESEKCLSESGKLFLPRAKRIIRDILDCALFTENSASNDNVVIRTSALHGKNFILPCMKKLEANYNTPDSYIELVTSEDEMSSELINSHVLFCNMSRVDRLFFERKWFVSMNQGLYASEGYLLDVGKIPEYPEDLLTHSILGYGDSFDCETTELTNWHLSGQYGLCHLQPSIMINSKDVLITAVEFDLGIGPVVGYHNKISAKQLVRILPFIEGPQIDIDFAIRKFLPDKFKEVVAGIESAILDIVSELNLEVTYY